MRSTAKDRPCNLFGVEELNSREEARALVAYLAVEETGHSAADVARYPRLPTPGTGGQVGIGRANVLRSIKRGYET